MYFAKSLGIFTADLQRARPSFFSVPQLGVQFQQGVHYKLPPTELQLRLSIPIIGSLVRREVLKAMGLDHCRIAASK